MALKALLTRKKIDAETKKLEALRAKDAEFEKREKELEAAINEMTEDTPEEDRAQVESEVNALNDEKRANEDEKSKIQNTIDELQKILDDDEGDQPAANSEPGTDTPARKDGNIMHTRFNDMTYAERKAFCEQENVRSFIQNIRDIKTNPNTDVIVPEEVLPLLKESIDRHSKLRSVVNLKQISGKARLPIMGEVPEAVWTEMGGKINELSLEFSAIDIDGYKVAGFIPAANWLLEDNDVDLMGNITDAIGQAIGYALDKAIVYGDGTKKPTGIAKDIKTKVDITDATGVALFQQLLLASGKASHDYAPNNKKIWLMNETTLTKIKAEAMTFNAAGAIVAEVEGTMPVIGGNIITLDFIPDDVIFFGYAGLYLLGERRGMTIAQSTEVRFLDDETVIKGTARYDGRPVRDDAFIVIGLGSGKTDSVEPKTEFPEDEANMG